MSRSGPDDTGSCPERGHSGAVFSGPVLRDLIEAAPDATVVTDPNGLIVLVNQRVEDLFGYHRDQLLGQPVEALVPAAARADHERHRLAFSAAPSPRPMGQGRELAARRSDGSSFDAEISLSPLLLADGPYVIASVRDVTVRRQHELALREAQQALAVSEDRERIARDLHDTVIQRLFATGLVLEGLSMAAPEPLRQRARLAVDEIDTTIREIRTAVFALGRRSGDAVTLRDEVLELCAQAARILGSTPVLRVTGPVDSVTPDRVRPHVVATVREALSNVARHAHASKVTIDLSVDKDRLRLVVADNGTGLSEGGTTGNGLRNLAERAELLGGTMVLRSRNGEGTELEWSVPVSEREAQQPIA